MRQLLWALSGVCILSCANAGVVVAIGREGGENVGTPPLARYSVSTDDGYAFGGSQQLNLTLSGLTTSTYSPCLTDRAQPSSSRDMMLFLRGSTSRIHRMRVGLSGNTLTPVADTVNTTARNGVLSFNATSFSIAAIACHSPGNVATMVGIDTANNKLFHYVDGAEKAQPLSYPANVCDALFTETAKDAGFTAGGILVVHTTLSSVSSVWAVTLSSTAVLDCSRQVKVQGQINDFGPSKDGFVFAFSDDDGPKIYRGSIDMSADIAPPVSSEQRRRRLLAATTIEGDATSILPASFASTVSYTFDVLPILDDRTVLFRTYVSSDSRRRLLATSTKNLDKTKDKKMWALDYKVGDVLEITGGYTTFYETPAVEAVHFFSDPTLYTEEDYVFGPALVGSGAFFATSSSVGASGGGGASVAANPPNPASAAAAGSSSGMAGFAAWLTAAHTQRSSLLARSAPAFSRDLAELGRVMNWMSFHWTFANVPVDWIEPFPRRMPSLTSTVRPLYIQQPEETLPSILLAVLVSLLVIPLGLGLIRLAIVALAAKGVWKFPALLSKFDFLLRWTPAIVGARIFLLSYKPIVHATAQHIGFPESTGLGHAPGYLVLAWFIFLLYTTGCIFYVATSMTHWTAPADLSAWEAEREQKAAAKREADAKREAAAKREADDGDVEANKVSSSGSDITTSPAKGSIHTGAAGGDGVSTLELVNAEGDGSRSGASRISSKQPMKKSKSRTAWVENDVGAEEGRAPTTLSKGEREAGRSGNCAAAKVHDSRAPPSNESLVLRNLMVGPLYSDLSPGCWMWSIVHVARDWFDMLYTGALVHKPVAQLVMLYLNQAVYIVAFGIVAPFEDRSAYLLTLWVEICSLSFMFWGLLLLAVPRSPFLVIMAFFSNFVVSLTMLTITIVPFLPQKAQKLVLTPVQRMDAALTPVLLPLREKTRVRLTAAYAKTQSVRTRFMARWPVAATLVYVRVGSERLAPCFSTIGTMWMRGSDAIASKCKKKRSIHPRQNSSPKAASEVQAKVKAAGDTPVTHNVLRQQSSHLQSQTKTSSLDSVNPSGEEKHG